MLPAPQHLVCSSELGMSTVFSSPPSIPFHLSLFPLRGLVCVCLGVMALIPTLTATWLVLRPRQLRPDTRLGFVNYEPAGPAACGSADTATLTRARTFPDLSERDRAEVFAFDV